MNAEAPPFAKRFFMSLLPRHIVQNIEKFAAQQGSISFYVREQGKWTVNMGNVEDPIAEGMNKDADLSLWFGGAAFEGFVKGTLDVVDAVGKGEVKFDGDVMLLEKFGLLLAPPGNALSTRFNR